jgi:sugar lactone lactonase YvrE
MNVKLVRTAASGLLSFALLLQLMLFSASAGAQDTPLSRGLGWLQAQVQPDGTLSGEPASIATPLQARSETLYTLKLLGAPAASQAPLRQSLTAEQDLSTEYMARRAWALGYGGVAQPALIEELQKRQNGDGGYGGDGGYASNIADTSWMLLAQRAGGAQPDAAAVTRALAFLDANHMADGSFAVNRQASMYATLKAMLASAAWSSQQGVGSFSAQSLNWLLAQRNGAGNFGNPFDNALALWVLATQTADQAILKPASDALLATQLANGSWNDDPYLTAVALRALYLVNHPPASNGSASVRGLVADAASGLPLAGASVQVVAGGDAATGSDANGNFTLSGIAAGSLTLRFARLGYASRDVSLNVGAGQSLSVGTVALAPASLSATLSGIVRNDSGQALAGAVVAAGTASATTNASGAFTITNLSPGPLTVTVTAPNYRTVTVNLDVVANTSYTFSPGLTPSYKPEPTSATISGKVVNAASKAGIVGATVQMAGKTVTTTTGGAFSVSNVTPGAITIAVSAPGYQPVSGSGMAVAGPNTIGDIALSAMPTSSTLSGVVTDGATGAAVAGATVAVQGQGTPVLTDAAGKYLITGITGTGFALNVGAADYFSQVLNVALPQPGNATVDIKLQKRDSSAADISFIKVATPQHSYFATGLIPLEVLLANNAAQGATILMTAQVINKEGNIVHTYLGNPGVSWRGQEPDNRPLALGANSTLELMLEWNTLRLPAGSYAIKARAFDESGRVVAEADSAFEVIAAPRLAGGVLADPPLAQAGAKTVVTFTGDVVNNGNEVLAAGDMQLKVTLAAQEPVNGQTEASVRTLASGAPLLRARKLKLAPAGWMYTVNYVDGKVLRLDTDGTQTVLGQLPSGFSYADTAMDAAGNIWVGYNAVLHRLSPQGVSTRFDTTQINDIAAMASTAEGLLLAGRYNGESRLVLRADNGQETILARNGFSGPVAMVKDDAGNYVVSNSSDGTLVKVAASDGTISPFVRNLRNPQGIARDAAGNFYVAEADLSRVAKVTPGGEVSVYATGLGTPYGLAFDGGGTLYVSDTNNDAIHAVQPNGTVALFARGFGYQPRGMAYDLNGDLLLLNSGDGTLRRKDAQNNVSFVASGMSAPHTLAVLPNGDYLVTEYGNGKVTRISNGVKSSFATGLNGPVGIALDGAGNVHVTEYGANRISRFAPDGSKLGVTESLLVRPYQVRAAANGDIYIRNSGSMVRYAGGEYKYWHRSFNYSNWTPDITPGSVLALSGTTLVRIDSAGAVTTVRSGLPFTPYSVALDAAGNIYLNDYSNRKIHKLDTSGTLRELVTLANYPYTASMSDLQADTAGNLVLRTGGGFYRVSPEGALTPISFSLPHVYNWTAGGENEIVVFNYDKTYRVNTITGASTLLMARGTYSSNAGIAFGAVSPSNQLWLVDDSLYTLTAHSMAGEETARLHGFENPTSIVFSGTEMRFVDNAERFMWYADEAYPSYKGKFAARYLAHANGATYGTASSTSINKYVGGAQVYQQYHNAGGYALGGLAVRADGGLAFSYWDDGRVVVLSPSRTVELDFAGLRAPQGLAFDASGKLYVASNANNMVSRFTPASGPAGSIFARMSSPVGLAFNAAGELFVSRTNGVDRVSTGGIVSNLSGIGGFNGMLAEGDSVLALNRSNSQLNRLRGLQSGWTSEVFASGLANPVALRQTAGGATLMLNINNNTIVSYQNGKVDHLANVPAGMLAFDLAPDGSMLAVGSSGTVVRIGTDGVASDLLVNNLVNRWQLNGVAVASDSQSYLVAQDDSSRGVLYAMNQSAPVQPPAVGSVVFESVVPMAELGIDGSYQKLNFGTWVPPYGGDFRIEMSRSGIDGTMQNFLHVGPNAQSQLTAARSELPPGDSVLQMCLDLKGADYTTISRVELGQVRTVSKSLTPRGMASDRAGKLYVTDSSQLYRTDASGGSTVIASGMNLAFGLASDSQENFYVASRNSSTGRYEVLRITRAGAKTVVADLGVNNAAGVQVNSRDEVLVGTVGKLLKVTQQGVVSTVATSGFPSPRGIAVDGRDNVYVQNENHSVSMVKPDGSSVAIFSKADGTDHPYFEGDGYPNIAADCADNFYIAPYQWSRIGQSGEEYSLAQVVPRTGQIARLFDTRTIAPNLADIDYLAFDRFNNRILMWNDNDQSIWQVPVTCGAIGVQAHLLAKPGQQLTGASKPPSAVVPLADGRTEYVWNLRDVTAQGAQVCFGANQAGMQLGEVRSTLDSGFISFQNTFAAGDVSVPLKVPMVRAANVVNIGATTDKPEYLAGESALVTTSLGNANTEVANGDLRVDVYDARGELVNTVTQQAVGIPAGGSLQVNGAYAAGQLQPGVYTARAVLSENGQAVASAKVDFRVLADLSQAAAATTLALDKQNYAPTDRVAISSRVLGQSANVTLDNLTLAIQVYDQSNAQVFGKAHAIVQLAPGAKLDFASPFRMVNAQPGTYRVEQQLRDSAGRVLDSRSAAYAVSSSAETGYGLGGSITAMPKMVPIGDSLAFTFQVVNNGNSALDNLPLTVSLLDPVAQQVRAEFPYSTSLPAGGIYNGAGNWLADGEAGRNYVAKLGATVGGKQLTLAQDAFQLLPKSKPDVKLGIEQRLLAGNRVLALVSCNDEENDAPGSDGKPPVCVTERLQAIDAALTELEVPHLVVTSPEAFQAKLRSGLFNTYWISGKEDKMSAQQVAELRERINGGEGLIVDGVHDNRNKVFDAVTGILYRGKIGETDLPVRFNGPLFDAQRLRSVGRAIKPIADGSTPQAVFEGSMPQADGPAVFSNAYGNGHSMLFGFDLASSLARETGWLPVLRSALAAVLPQAAEVPMGGALVPLRTTITNQSEAVELEVTVQLPAGASFQSATPEAVFDQASNTVRWRLSLSAGQSSSLELQVMAPAAAGQYVLETTVSWIDKGTALQYGDKLQRGVTVNSASQYGTAALSAIDKLAVTHPKYRKPRDNAANALRAGMGYFGAGTQAGYAAAIASLLAATDNLLALPNDTAAIRQQIDCILREAEWRWSRLQPQQ